MRDQERIKSFLSHINELWLQSPDLRFGQLVLVLDSEAKAAGKDLFYLEEPELIKIIDRVTRILSEGNNL